MLKKIKKEHIILLVLVIVVLLLIFINIKNKRVLRERFNYPDTYPPHHSPQDNYYNIVFSTIDETRNLKKIGKIGIIGRNEELFFK